MAVARKAARRHRPPVFTLSLGSVRSRNFRPAHPDRQVASASNPDGPGQWHLWRSRECVRCPDRFRTHCRGHAGSGLPPTPPEKKREQSGARSRWRFRHPALTRSWCRPLDTTPHPTDCGAIPVAPDWLNRRAPNDPPKNQIAVMLVDHDVLDPPILTRLVSRGQSSGAIGLSADSGIGRCPSRSPALIPPARDRCGAGLSPIEQRDAAAPSRPSGATCF